MDWIVLAQQKQPPLELWIACAILIGMIVLLGTGVLLYRRMVLTGSDSAGKANAWNLDDLTRLRSQGEISEAEYQAMRATIIQSFTGERVVDPGVRLPEVPPNAFPSVSAGQESDNEQEWDWVAEGHQDEADRRKSDT